MFADSADNDEESLGILAVPNIEAMSYPPFRALIDRSCSTVDSEPQKQRPDVADKQVAGRVVADSCDSPLAVSAQASVGRPEMSQERRDEWRRLREDLVRNAFFPRPETEDA
jgi:hypothetical protein